MSVHLFVFAFISLVLLAPSARAQEPSIGPCQYPDSYIKHTANNIKDYYELGDVSAWVNNLERYMTRCQISPATYGWGKGTFDYWRDTGIKAERETVKARLARQAAVGKTSKADRDLLQRIDKIMKIPPAETAAFLKAQAESTQNNQSSCEPQDLRGDRLGPVHDQERLGWCYAFTAADLLSYKLGEKVSAADIATTYTDGWKKELAATFGKMESEQSAGFTKDAIEKMQNLGGVCREKDFASDAIEGTSLDTALNQLQQKKASYNASDSVCGPDMAALTRFLPNVRPQEYIDILKTSNRASFVKELRDKSCSPRADISQIKVAKEFGGDLNKNRALFDSIDKQLDEKNIVEMAYWSETFTSTNPERLKERSGAHSSIIVGRRFNSKTQSCEYLVRNSYGSKNPTSRNLDNEEGHFWIPKEDLISEIGAITYLK